MSSIDIPVILFQIILPLGLLTWLALAPARSALGYIVQAGATGIGLLALALVFIWMIPPWWIPWLYIALWLSVVITHGDILAGTR